MDKFSDFLNTIGAFINHPIWLPAIIAIVGIIFFVVLFFKANRDVDKHRTETQQKIVNDTYSGYIGHKYQHQELTKEDDNTSPTRPTS